MLQSVSLLQKNIVFSAFGKHKQKCKKENSLLIRGNLGLDVEIEYFDQNRREWFKHHAGKIALVHGTTIYGFYDNYENAFKAGLDEIGINVSFLLKEVLLEDRVEWL